MSRTSLRHAALLALVSVGCAKGASNTAPAETKSRTAPKTASKGPGDTRPASLAKTPDAPAAEKPLEHGKRRAPPPGTPLKNVGKVGELLESDVFTFKLVSIAPCGEQPDPKTAAVNARRVVAAHVEITAKEGMKVSPRDVAVGVGGIVFNGSVDYKRKLEGCGPQLETRVLLPEQTTKGFVLFDIPVSGPGSDLDQMGLIYQPTRFGGAGAVMVRSFRG